jgi:phosphoenolpyruvate synthase/pyruvate phosphate dikinase
MAKIKWEKIVTREIPLLYVFYVNFGYVNLEKAVGLSFFNNILVNNNGIIERYSDPQELKRIYKQLVNLFKEKREEKFFKKANELDGEIGKIIRMTDEANLCKFSQKKLLEIFLNFDRKLRRYWIDYLAVFFSGPALENAKYSIFLKKYNQEIENLKGAYSARIQVEKIFFPKFLGEVEARAKINFSLLLFAFPGEIIDFLKGKKLFNKTKLEERKRYYVWFTKNGKGGYFTGDKAREVENRELTKKSEDYSSVSIIRGVTASPGKAKGNVKVVLGVKDSSKIKLGDILVTSMTNPKYIPAMRRAAAFVTDEGGLTCHAAILSRELNKPCVIGTKIATKVLKDGDLVEVDANKGIVKKLK